MLRTSAETSMNNKPRIKNCFYVPIDEIRQCVVERELYDVRFNIFSAFVAEVPQIRPMKDFKLRAVNP